MTKTEQITIRVDENLKAKIMLRALEENRTVADYIRLVVLKDIEQHQQQK